uniref:Reverse transcriptase domain-containing protein n=1 Tax=Nicotiana tabacum TaxID=4097 RepID=A0A1S4B646_TOBAC|nr:PREDICTED: uncharacterized protein LOC107804843 [Nicotiana tabacum]
MQQEAQPNVSYQQRDINQANLNMQTSETTIGVDDGEVQNNYLKLISSTNLEEEQNSGFEYNMENGRILGFQNAHSNSNSQIWIFWNDSVVCNVVEENEQQVTYSVSWDEVVVLDLTIPHYTIAKATEREHVKYFRFQNFWTEEEGFNVVVEQAWGIKVQGSPMWRFHLKLKNTCKKLSEWSKSSIGNIFDKIKELEGRVADLEANLITDNSEKKEALFEEDKERRWKLGDGEEDVAKEAISFFQRQFKKESCHNDFSVLSCIPKTIEEADYDRLTTLLMIEELKDVVFSMSSQSAPSPDEVSAKLYHSCIDIPKALTHTCLKLVSPNQTGFIKGRSITENIMLTQVVHNINKSSLAGNVVLKRNMAKAYDRVSWEYLCPVLRQMVFSECWIDMVWRLMTNVWYSININGIRYGFFKSSRGIKQGDPLSPSLFVIGAELLSKLMGSLIGSGFNPYFAEKKGPTITHLCYADDTILFSSCDSLSLNTMMEKLRLYEQVSG